MDFSSLDIKITLALSQKIMVKPLQREPWTHDLGDYLVENSGRLRIALEALKRQAELNKTSDWDTVVANSQPISGEEARALQQILVSCGVDTPDVCLGKREKAALEFVQDLIAFALSTKDATALPLSLHKAINNLACSYTEE